MQFQIFLNYIFENLSMYFVKHHVLYMELFIF